MKVFLHQIKDHQDYVLNLTEADAWVSDLVTSLDEKIYNVPRPAGWKPKVRPIVMELKIRKIDDLYEVDGRVKTLVNLLCSLCADGFGFPINTRFRALYTQNPQYQGHIKEGAEGDQEVHRVFGKQGQESDDDGDDDFEVQVLNDHFIDLVEVIHEQMVLMIPMQPRPEMDTDERCRKCGLTPAQLGLSKAEEGEAEMSPFASLKGLFPKKEDGGNDGDGSDGAEE